MKAGTELALRFNDQSVLENHHCVVAFGLLQQHNIFAPLSQADRRSVRCVHAAPPPGLTTRAAHLTRAAVCMARTGRARYRCAR